jgi:hypothetical protein
MSLDLVRTVRAGLGPLVQQLCKVVGGKYAQGQ